MSRAYTEEEVREQFLGAVKQVARAWARYDVTKREIADGVACSILSIIDGVSGSFPMPLNLSVDACEDSKKDFIEEGEDYYEDGIFNGGVYLHDNYYQ